VTDGGPTLDEQQGSAGSEIPGHAEGARVLPSRLAGLIAAGVVAILAIAFVAVPGLRDDDRLPPPPQTTYGGVPLPLGAPQSVAVILPNPDHKRIRIIEVDATVSRNAEFVGVLATVPPHSGPYESSVGPGFPAHRPAWGLEFHGIPVTFEPDHFPRREGRRHVEIVLGLGALSGEFAALNGVTVTYEIGHKRRTQYFPTAFIVCVAPADCDAEPDSAVLLQRLGVMSQE
jgi:hypothetical protein